MFNSLYQRLLLTVGGLRKMTKHQNATPLLDSGTSTRGRSGRSRLIWSILGFLLLGGLVYWGGAEAMAAFLSTPFYYVVAIIVTAYILAFISTYRWQCLGQVASSGVPARELGARVSFWGHYRSFIYGRALGLIMPQVVSDFGGRTIVHKGTTGGSAVGAFNGVLFEKVLDLSLMFAMAIPSLSYLFGGQSLERFIGWLVISLVGWVGLLILASRKASVLWQYLSTLSAVTKVEKSSLFSRAMSFGRQALLGLMQISENSSILRKGLALTVLRYSLICLQFILIAASIGAKSIHPIEVVAAIPAAQMALIFSVTPGGIGFIEGGLWGVLQALGGSSEDITKFLVAQRIWFFVSIVVQMSIAVTVHGLKDWLQRS